jgi:hypothetical protein
VRADLDAIGRLTVPGKNGPVLLANVADITMESGPAEIDRLNRSRNVTLDVELGGRSLGEVNAEARALPALTNLPASVQIAELGDAQEMQALFASFGVAMTIGVLCIYGVLVLLFTDFMQPVTILAALPLSIGGAFVALLVTGSALSMPTMIGLIMLMGIVTKNSILLVDYAILARKAGMNRFDALVDACHKRSRPIIMTTIAMGAGMMPLALGFSGDPSFRSPMAIAVIGGLITSTLLSLLVVPAVFTYVDDIKHWVVVAGIAPFAGGIGQLLLTITQAGGGTAQHALDLVDTRVGGRSQAVDDRLHAVDGLVHIGLGGVGGLVDRLVQVVGFRIDFGIDFCAQVLGIAAGARAGCCTGALAVLAADRAGSAAAAHRTDARCGGAAGAVAGRAWQVLALVERDALVQAARTRGAAQVARTADGRLAVQVVLADARTRTLVTVGAAFCFVRFLIIHDEILVKSMTSG